MDRTQQPIYVVIGHEGEWSSLQVWVAGAYTDKQRAISVAEAQKDQDRARWAIWSVWNAEFGKRLQTAGEYVHANQDIKRKEQIERLGLPNEPPIGSPDTDYFVACVPLNTPGRWDYEP